MENKPNQPAPGANSSQATGTSKTTSPAATADRVRTSPAASANTVASPDTASVSSTPSSASANQRQDQPQDQQAPDSGQAKQSWTNVSSWLDSANQQIPQSVKDSVKDISTKATDQFNKLTPTQKIVGGALLVSGLSWLALRSKTSKSSKSDYRSGSYQGSRTYSSFGAGTTADQQFQGPYGNSPTRGISDDYPTKSSTDYRDSDISSGYRRSDSASTSGFGEDTYSTDL